MIRTTNTQISLKPQDLLVTLKVAVAGGRLFTYALLASELSMSVSQVHSAVKRAHTARLINASIDEGITPHKAAIQEFVIYGVRYAFPAMTGAMTRGMPTAFAGPSLREVISQEGQIVPVWPDSHGSTRGYALTPIYPTVPKASALDSRLYEVLTLIDTLRIGAARERELAAILLRRQLV